MRRYDDVTALATTAEELVQRFLDALLVTLHEDSPRAASLVRPAGPEPLRAVVPGRCGRDRPCPAGHGVADPDPLRGAVRRHRLRRRRDRVRPVRRCLLPRGADLARWCGRSRHRPRGAGAPADAPVGPASRGRDGGGRDERPRRRRRHGGVRHPAARPGRTTSSAGSRSVARWRTRASHSATSSRRTPATSTATRPRVSRCSTASAGPGSRWSTSTTTARPARPRSGSLDRPWPPASLTACSPSVSSRWSEGHSPRSGRTVPTRWASSSRRPSRWTRHPESPLAPMLFGGAGTDYADAVRHGPARVRPDRGEVARPRPPTIPTPSSGTR